MKKIELFDIPTHFSALYNKAKSKLWYGHFLGKISAGSILISPIKMNRPCTLFLDKQVLIQKYSWFFSVHSTSKILIGSRTQIGHYFHCVSFNQISIGREVLIADRVFIADCTHDYKETGNSIINNNVQPLHPVSIGDESWIGEGVCIIGASVGKHCVIGANSVVTHDVPDYCVAAGSPAKVISQYDAMEGKWKKINK